MTPEEKAEIEKFIAGGCQFPLEHSATPGYWCEHCHACSLCAPI